MKLHGNILPGAIKMPKAKLPEHKPQVHFGEELELAKPKSKPEPAAGGKVWIV